MTTTAEPLAGAGALWLTPAVVHRLAVVVRLVDAFTGAVVRERFDVRLVGHEWWTPIFRATDATYRFKVTNAPVPALGATPVRVTPLAVPTTYRDLGGLSVTIPRPGPPPVPLVAGYYLVDHELWPTWAFRPPPGETFVAGRVVRAGRPVADQRVRAATSAAALPAAPAAPTDADGQFVYRLPGLRVSAATPGTVVDSAGLFFAVSDSGGAAQALAAPALPVTVRLGRPFPVTLDLV